MYYTVHNISLDKPGQEVSRGIRSIAPTGRSRSASCPTSTGPDHLAQREVIESCLDEHVRPIDPESPTLQAQSLPRFTGSGRISRFGTVKSRSFAGISTVCPPRACRPYSAGTGPQM